MRVACGDVYVGSWRPDRSPDRSGARPAPPPARPRRAGRAPRGARSSSGRARKQEKNFILPYAHHEASKPSPYGASRPL